MPARVVSRAGIHMRFAEFVHPLKNRALYFVWLWHALHHDFVLIGAGALHVNSAKIKYRLKKSIIEHARILYALQRERGRLADKKIFLLGMDNAVVGDDPHIEVMIRPDDGKCDQDAQKPCSHAENEERCERAADRAHCPQRDAPHDGDKHPNEHDADRISKKHKPMLPDVQQRLFFGLNGEGGMRHIFL